MKKRKSTDENLTYRSITVRAGEPSSLNIDERSVEIVLATENPSLVFDFNRYEPVMETLIISGCELPKTKQVPMLDVHSRWSTSSVLGSIRELKKGKAELVGRAFFSAVESVEETWTKVREGHITDFSAGYKPIESQYVAEGESYTYKGVTYEGPHLVTKKWRIREGSVVPIGADEFATARAAKINENPNKEASMDEKLRHFLIRRGLAEDATEAEAWDFLESLETRVEPGKPPVKEDPIDVDAIRATATEEERVRIDEIIGLGTRFDCLEIAKKAIPEALTVEEAKARMADAVLERALKKPTTPHMPPATVIEDGTDKFRAAAVDSLILRSSNLKVEKPAPGAEELNGFSLKELSRECLRNSGQSMAGSSQQLVGRALETSDLPYIMANVANKSLAKGWDTAPETWQVWCDTGSVPDFKTNYVPRMSEFDDLDEVPEHGEYTYGKVTEAQESYIIATYGKLFAITRQAIINDDLGAITRVPAARGEAAARKVGDVAYAVLTANAAMGDGVALFHATHANFVANGSGAAPGTATITAGVLAMGLQTDIRGLRSLNIRPEYLIAPKTLEGGTEIFLQTFQYSDSDTVATDSSLAATRKNIYSGSYFTRVYDARLDASDAAAWFLAARKGQTVTVFFLDGVQAPYMEQQAGWTVDGTEYKVRIDCAAKALDTVGLYMNDGN